MLCVELLLLRYEPLESSRIFYACDLNNRLHAVHSRFPVFWLLMPGRNQEALISHQIDL